MSTIEVFCFNFALFFRVGQDRVLDGVAVHVLIAAVRLVIVVPNPGRDHAPTVRVHGGGQDLNLEDHRAASRVPDQNHKVSYQILQFLGAFMSKYINLRLGTIF